MSNTLVSGVVDGATSGEAAAWRGKPRLFVLGRGAELFRFERSNRFYAVNKLTRPGLGSLNQSC